MRSAGRRKMTSLTGWHFDFFFFGGYSHYCWHGCISASLTCKPRMLRRPPGDSNQTKVIIRPLSKPLAALQESSSQRDGAALRQSVQHPANTCRAPSHKSDGTLAWKAEVIIWDNQAFTLLTLKEKAVYGNEGWGGCAWLYQARNPQIGSVVTPPKNESGIAANTHLRRIYNSGTVLGGLSTCFMTSTIRGDIGFFYVWHL